MLLVMPVGTLFAQETDDHSPWALTVAVGASLPLGTFATMLEEPYRSNYGLSGRPLPGQVFGGMVEYELFSSVLPFVQINYARMPAGDLSTTDMFFPNSYSGHGAWGSSGISSQDQGVWEVGQLLGGVGFRRGGGSLSFTVHMEAGAQWMHSPAVVVNSRSRLTTITATEWAYSTQTVQPAAGSWSLVAGGGVDLGIFLSPRFVLRIGGAVHATSASFTYINRSTTDGQRIDAPGTSHSSATEHLEIKQPIRTFQFTLGTTYRFRSRH